MISPSPAQKVRILEGSICCFVLGLCSLVPLVGAGFAVAALREGHRVSREAAPAWNPARIYLRFGYGLALVGLFLTAALVVVVALWIQHARGF